MSGRMPVVGAALGGKDGVKHVLLNLLSDTHCTMINCGVESVKELHSENLSMLTRAPHAGRPPFM